MAHRIGRIGRLYGRWGRRLHMRLVRVVMLSVVTAARMHHLPRTEDGTAVSGFPILVECSWCARRELLADTLWDTEPATCARLAIRTPEAIQRISALPVRSAKEVR